MFLGIKESRNFFKVMLYKEKEIQGNANKEPISADKVPVSTDKDLIKNEKYIGVFS